MAESNPGRDVVSNIDSMEIILAVRDGKEYVSKVVIKNNLCAGRRQDVTIETLNCSRTYQGIMFYCSARVRVQVASEMVFTSVHAAAKFCAILYFEHFLPTNAWDMGQDRDAWDLEVCNLLARCYTGSM